MMGISIVIATWLDYEDVLQTKFVDVIGNYRLYADRQLV